MVANATMSDGCDVPEMWVCHHLYKHSGMMQQMLVDSSAIEEAGEFPIVAAANSCGRPVMMTTYDFFKRVYATCSNSKLPVSILFYPIENTWGGTSIFRWNDESLPVTAGTDGGDTTQWKDLTFTCIHDV